MPRVLYKSPRTREQLHTGVGRVILDLMNVDYVFGRGGKPEVVLMGRNEKQEKIGINVTDFKPYYYEPDENGDYESIFNVKMSKIVCETTGEVERNRSSKSGESDVPFGLRYIIDKQLFCGFEYKNRRITPAEGFNVLPRIGYWDIEVKSPPDKFPHVVNPIYPISNIGVIDSYTGEFTKFFLDDYDSEVNMLFDFFDTSHQFDALGGYYSNHYDLPYVIGRCAELGISYKHWSPLNKFIVKKSGVFCGGLQFIDYFDWYLKMFKPRGLPPIDLDLKSVVKYETGFEYEDYGDQIEWLYENDKDTLNEYNKNDVTALLLLDQKLKITEYFDSIRRTAGCPISWANTSSWVHDTLLLRIGHDRRWVLPNRPQFNPYKHVKSSYTGATVKVPPLGLQKDIAVFDFAGAYPWIIIRDGISPDPKKIIPVLVRILMKGRAKYKKMETDYLAKGGSPGDHEYKMIWYVEQAYKYLINSVYGYLAYPMSRVGDKAMSAKVTAKCRKALDVCEVQLLPDYPAIYADTDSLHIHCSQKDTQLIEDILNDVLAEYLNGTIDIEYEKYFKSILFKVKEDKRKKMRGKERGAQKRYVARVVYENEKKCDYMLKVGIEAKRSNNAKITKEVMARFLEQVVMEDDVSGAYQLLRDEVANFRDNPIDRIKIPKGLSRGLDEYTKKFPHLTGTQFSVEFLGLKYRTDKRPNLIKVKKVIKTKEMGNKMMPKKVKYITIYDDNELPDNVIVDYNAMCKATLENKMGGWLKSLGTNWKQVITKTKQEGIASWMS